MHKQQQFKSSEEPKSGSKTVRTRPLNRHHRAEVPPCRDFECFLAEALMVGFLCERNPANIP